MSGDMAEEIRLACAAERLSRSERRLESTINGVAVARLSL